MLLRSHMTGMNKSGRSKITVKTKIQSIIFLSEFRCMKFAATRYPLKEAMISPTKIAPAIELLTLKSK